MSYAITNTKLNDNAAEGAVASFADATGANISPTTIAVDGDNIVIPGKIKTIAGTNASWNTSAAMTAGAVTITNTSVTANSVILYSRKTTGGTAGQVSITAQSAGSFTLTSSSNTETSTFNYQIVN